MNIPELSINPLAHRLERVFESVNFKVTVCKLYGILYCMAVLLLSPALAHRCFYFITRDGAVCKRLR